MKLKMRWPQRKNWSSAASNLVTTRSRGRTQLPMQTSLLAWLTPLTLIIQTTLIRSYLSTSPCWVAQTTQSHRGKIPLFLKQMLARIPSRKLRSRWQESQGDLRNLGGVMKDWAKRYQVRKKSCPIILRQQLKKTMMKMISKRQMILKRKRTKYIRKSTASKMKMMTS